jgi:hypothetical protein
MVHFPPLRGAALHDIEAGIDHLLAVAKRDLDVLVNAGFDAVLFCNEGDKLYSLSTPPQGIATMSALISRCLPIVWVSRTRSKALSRTLMSSA